MNVFKELAEIWNQNLKKCMKERGLSQNGLAKAMTNARLDDDKGSVSQQDVSRWRNVGSGKGNGSIRRFPEVETMKEIANILGVDLGYLLGETDYTSFDTEKAASYTGLEPRAIDNIRYITGNTYSRESLNHGVDCETYRSIISEVLASKEFVNFIIAVKGLKDAQEQMKKLSETDPFEKINKNMSDELFRQAWAISSGYDPDGDELPEATPELVDAVHQISAAQDKGYDIQCELEKQYPVKVARYELNAILVRWIDSLDLTGSNHE